MDPVLESFLKANDDEVHSHLERILTGVIPAVRSITARSREFQEDDQQEALSRLIRMLWACRRDPEHHNIDDINRYSMVVASHICKERLRRTNPIRSSLKDSLRHLLKDEKSAFAMWRSDSGDLLCGLSKWEGNQTCSSENLSRLMSFPDELRDNTLSEGKVQDSGNHSLVLAIFDRLGHPLRFDDLTRITFLIRGIEEVTLISDSDRPEKRAIQETIQSPDDFPDETAEWREFLNGVWGEIESLPPLQRIAYLLNFTAAGGEIDIFMKYGVAGIRKIGRVLGLDDEQYSIAWRELIPDAEARKNADSLSTRDEKFARLWSYLPLPDQVIARILGTERQKIINLRKAAGARLSRRIGQQEKSF